MNNYNNEQLPDFIRETDRNYNAGCLFLIGIPALLCAPCLGEYIFEKCASNKSPQPITRKYQAITPSSTQSSQPSTRASEKGLDSNLPEPRRR